MCTYEELAMRITKYLSGGSPHGNGKHYLSPGMCDIYTVMMVMLRYSTPDAGCPLLSNVIHHGQHVNGSDGFTCSLQRRHQEGPAHQTSHVQCMLHTNCWAPHGYSVANQRHDERSQHTTYVSCPHILGHATGSHHLVPNCLGPDGIGNNNRHVHQKPSTHEQVKSILPICMFV